MKRPLTYRDSGVNIDEGDLFVDLIQQHVRRTLTPRVMRGFEGGYAGLFSLDHDPGLFKRNFRRPILVSGADGVGTKLKIAFLTGVHDTVGIDLVAMSVNDILTVGAEPLFFLDYVATSHLDAAAMSAVVKGIADGCEQAGCAILGGETAELPGFYQEGEYDLAGFAVGVVEKDRIIRGAEIEEGDAVLGLFSSGLHSNGFSLARKVLLETGGMKVSDHIDALGASLGRALLTPTIIYVQPILALLRAYRVKRIVRGLAHITGGGLVENVPRILPRGLAVRIDRKSWEVPPIFRLIQETGNVERAEMYRVFNMGVGMVVIVPRFNARKVLARLERHGVKGAAIGDVVRGAQNVEIV
ncbi:MAG: phosphoribosylformylglycinamidine cyclo-ligase [Planctomycetes bacterium]|nr:phosphoribosylformylglycinamidine cyclo-ligase [Planctomycetota bacterium]